MTAQDIYLGQAESGPQTLLLKYANRHGLIAGATGTGKTVTLQRLAEGFSAAGVPVFLADVKGDLSGMSQAGAPKPAFVERAARIGFTQSYAANPVIFWDIFGAQGHPIRATASEMGPLLLSQLLDLNDAQEGTLNVAFRAADSEGMLLLDMDDLRAMLQHLSENASQYSAQYGNVAASSVAAIQRALLTLDMQGGKQLFGEPALDLADFMKLSPDGRGAVNVLAADKLLASPKLYASFLLWLMSELFEQLPEAGDLDKPKLVFFFDEAHLLFDGAPKALIDKIEQLVRLIRSKGVGIYFITQNPADIPPTVLGQLSNRVQHALRAYTPDELKGVKAAAQSFRVNPAFKTEEAITLLGIGEALVSTLDAKGVPTIVERTLIAPPASRVGPATLEERKAVIAGSPLVGKYETAVNRESAAEMLSARVTQAASPWGVQQPRTAQAGGGSAARPVPAAAGMASSPLAKEAGKIASRAANMMMRNVTNRLARELTRGLFNTLLK